MRDSAREILRRAATEVRAGARVAREASLAPPPSPSSLRRFGYGVALPFSVLRGVLADPFARRQYLRATLTQAAVTLVVGAALTLSSHRLEERFDGRDGMSVVIYEGLGFWSALYATLSVTEWLVVALSRQYGDQVSRAAAVLAGVPPEDDLAPPRVRIDLRWMWRKLKRRLRGTKVFVSGLPLLWFAVLVPAFGSALHVAAVLAWGAYWTVVSAAAKTAHGWTDAAGVMRDAPGREPPPDPWFIRGFDRLTQTPIGRWWLPRLCLRLWRRLTLSMFPPCLSVEEAPWELAGIAVVRALAALPGFYLLLRPLLPVAAAKALLERRAEGLPQGLQ